MRLFSAAATGTQTTNPLKSPKESLVGFCISHPAGATTAYTVQASDDGVTYFTHVTIGSKSSAENFTWSGVSPFPFHRLSMVTSVAAGTITVDGHTKRG